MTYNFGIEGSDGPHYAIHRPIDRLALARRAHQRLRAALQSGDRTEIERAYTALNSAEARLRPSERKRLETELWSR